MKFNYEGEFVRVEEGRPGTRKYLIRYPEIWEFDEEVRRQHTELERIYKLPELEWLLVKSLMMQQLASLSRNGWSAEWSSRVLATIDQGSTYVHRLIQERDQLKERLVVESHININMQAEIQKLLEELRRDVAISKE